jgi:hypothetical protein
MNPLVKVCIECGREFVPELGTLHRWGQRRLCSDACKSARLATYKTKCVKVRKVKRELKKEESKPQPKKVNIYKMVHEKARAFARSK